MRGKALLLGLILLAGAGLAAAQSPLFSAAQSGTAADIRSHVAAGEAVDVTDEYGQTPLIYAAASNPDVGVLRALVELGADVNHRTSAGWTSLMYAARDTANPDILRTLVELGADLTARNNDGQSALDLLSANASADVREVRGYLQEMLNAQDPVNQLLDGASAEELLRNYLDEITRPAGSAGLDSWCASVSGKRYFLLPRQTQILATEFNPPRNYIAVVAVASNGLVGSSTRASSYFFNIVQIDGKPCIESIVPYR